MKDFIDHEHREWKVNKLLQHCTHEQLQTIQNIRIPPQPAKDRLCWSLTRNGEFSVRSTYMAILMQHRHQVVSEQHQRMWLMIWHLEIPYKCQLFLWKVAQQILPVAAKFQRVACLGNCQCGMCGSTLETADHLLLQCSFAKEVWLGVSHIIMQEAYKFPKLDFILDFSG